MSSRLSTQRRTRSGFMVLDLVFSMVILLVLLMALTASVAKMKRAEKQLSDTRANVRKLEAGLFALESGGSAGNDVTVERIAAAAPVGRAWVRVSLPAPEKSKQSLVGLVPAADAPAGRQP